jgi:hypothetical protein
VITLESGILMRSRGLSGHPSMADEICMQFTNSVGVAVARGSADETVDALPSRSDAAFLGAETKDVRGSVVAATA